MLCQRFILYNNNVKEQPILYKVWTLYTVLQWLQKHHYDKLTTEIQRKTTQLMFERTEIGNIL